MDKRWMQKERWGEEYREGVERFLDFAFEKASDHGLILCPCINCVNDYWHGRGVVYEHLICEGFVRGYTNWYFHGEIIPSSNSTGQSSRATSSFTLGVEDDVIGEDDIGGLLRDAFGMHNQHFQDPSPQNRAYDVPNVGGNNIGDAGEDIGDEEPIGEAAKFYKLLDEMNKPLYEKSKHSKLAFSIRLFHLKCTSGMTGKCLDSLLELLKDVFPFADIPASSYQSKKLIKDLGLGYEKIHSCKKDCMLYWGDRANQQSCHVCGTSRWLETNSNESLNVEDEGEIEAKKKPQKVLRYFPLIPRLQRLFMSSKTASSMTWHEDGRTKDGDLRHPADSLAWKEFDSRYPEFASDPRNVRLGLAADGFNPFKLMSTSHSTWPVVLIPYNLPPWIGMKQQSFIMSMIIPGEKGPGNDIDIYLQPLVEELKQLWGGVETYDASRKQNFSLRAALLWTINDFPAYANLSGWSTKGRYACPCCAAETCSKWLSNGKKFCYMGHRRWLEEGDQLRFQGHLFDNSIELKNAPSLTSGSEILSMLKDVAFTYGKGKENSSSKQKPRKRVRDNEDGDVGSDVEEDDDPNEADLWKKRSIFFELEYWQHNLLRHNLDVMHIEKNVCENIVGTILNVDGKSKDNLKCRLDLVAMGIRTDLHPEVLPNGKARLPPACYGMSKSEKEVFLSVLKKVKVPDGYSSNISRCVNLKERKLYMMKSHDHHILLHDLLPLALRSSMSKRVTLAVIELCNVFKSVCGKVLKISELDKLQDRAAIALCHLEKIFPPSFFTIMVHLVIHLPLEAKLGGPVYYRWMYPVERFLLKLGSYLRNKRFPEGSIAEGYLAEECMTFCSRYLEGIEATINRAGRNVGISEGAVCGTYLFRSGGQPIGKVEVVELDDKSWAQAHRYVLFHHDAIEPLRT